MGHFAQYGGTSLFSRVYKLSFISRARTKAGAQIKSWRVWILWVDGDWTCETMKSFNAAQIKELESRVRQGSDIWPWPEGDSPKDNYRRSELKGRNMVRPNIYSEDRITHNFN